MKKKYVLLEKTMEVGGHILHRIRALRDFGSVKAGELGGWIESEENLSHEGDCWVGDEACVYGDGRVYGNAQVCGAAQVYGAAKVYGAACVDDFAEVYGSAQIYDKARVYDFAEVYGSAKVCDDDILSGVIEFG